MEEKRKQMDEVMLKIVQNEEIRKMMAREIVKGGLKDRIKQFAR